MWRGASNCANGTREDTVAKRVLITTDRLGRGDEELGRLLMRNFCYSLARAEERPAAVMLMNGGVRLACTGSEVLDDLGLLVENGVAIRVCGTCLDYLELTDSLAVGEVGTMPGAVEALLGEDGIVTIA
ncbi:MAG: sulfurtransferase-like selenium metabolism protein YedF [Anaerosomatales bacterium]|nr:sulfurtransferase-like selenium metabolism protein YedF [Anaerosomatales bacterium]